MEIFHATKNLDLLDIQNLSTRRGSQHRAASRSHARNQSDETFERQSLSVGVFRARLI